PAATNSEPPEAFIDELADILAVAVVADVEQFPNFCRIMSDSARVALGASQPVPIARRFWKRTNEHERQDSSSQERPAHPLSIMRTEYGSAAVCLFHLWYGDTSRCVSPFTLHTASKSTAAATPLAYPHHLCFKIAIAVSWWGWGRVLYAIHGDCLEDRGSLSRATPRSVDGRVTAAFRSREPSNFPKLLTAWAPLLSLWLSIVRSCFPERIHISV